MEEKLNKIRMALEPELEKLEIQLDSIVFEQENKYNYLRITLDKASGLDMDMVVEATNLINPILDELDLIEESYILEVSSKERGN